MTAAASVAANVRLDAVFLTSIQAVNQLGKGVSHAGLDMSAMVSYRYLGHRILDQRSLVVEIEGRLELKRKTVESQDQSAPEVTIVVAYGASYSLPKPPIPPHIDERAFASFAKINGPYNCWPYLRQQIQSIAASMDFLFVLPTLRIEVPRETALETDAKPSGVLPKAKAAKTKNSRKGTRKSKK